MSNLEQQLREDILAAVREYYAVAFPAKAFIPGQTPVPVSGRVFGAEELQFLVDASLDFWLTTGRFAERFEREFARFTGVRDTRLVNSGSSANLLALSAPHFVLAGRTATSAGRRGDHGCGGLSHHRQSDPAKPAGTGVRRRYSAHLRYRRHAT